MRLSFLIFVLYSTWVRWITAIFALQRIFLVKNITQWMIGYRIFELLYIRNIINVYQLALRFNCKESLIIKTFYEYNLIHHSELFNELSYSTNEN